MIKQISEYEYLGNSLETINSNMRELNIRIDNLYSEKEKWNSFSSTFQHLSGEFLSFITSVQTTSGEWKESSDLVHNTQGYWEEPVTLVYKKTFNSVANYVEVETWVNDNFPSENFSPSQIIRCDYLCKNYSGDSLQGARIPNYDPLITDNLAAAFSISVPDVFKYLGFRNQLTILVGIFNYYLTKYSLKDLQIETIAELESFRGILKFNKNTDSFQSEQLVGFSQTDLNYFHSYFVQYENIKSLYDEYIRIGYGDIPEYVYAQFEPKNVFNSIGGTFFFKNRNGRWTYHPYTNIEFCSNDTCSDCYDNIDVNELYGYRPPCLYTVKYVLSECEIPYGTPYGESDIESFDVEGDDLLDDLFS